jgi:VIT1/CCC1 family predicted Fe2+/Mn2+ transporter
LKALTFSIFTTLISLFSFGYFKSKITGVNPLMGAIRVTLIGAAAASTAFAVAKLFQG